MSDQPFDRLEDFEHDRFTFEGETKRVFRKGEGPGVVVITEVPGITPEVADFARRVVDAGFTVAMPSVLGTPGRPKSLGYIASSMTRACVSREFTVLARGESSAVTVWLRALARDLHERCGGPGVGAVGMCLTGNFALAMAIDPWLKAPVLSQPSLPLPVSPKHRRDLHLSDRDLATVKQRVTDENLPIIGLRFEGDQSCPRARFDRLEEEFGDAFIRVELPDSTANPRGRPYPPHSVLTTDLIDEPGEPTRDALDQVLDLFRRQLQPESDGPSDSG